MNRGIKCLLNADVSQCRLELAGKILERLGYRTLIAGTPEEALLLEAARSGEIHLLMADVVMPGLNGRDVAIKVRETMERN